MSTLFILFGHVLRTISKLLHSGGAPAIVAESVLVKQQLSVVGLPCHRASNSSPLDRFLFGFWSPFLGEHRIPRMAIILKPSSRLRFHHGLNQRKYRLLCTPTRPVADQCAYSRGGGDQNGALHIALAALR
jgi:hypothetical protein